MLYNDSYTFMRLKRHAAACRIPLGGRRMDKIFSTDGPLFKFLEKAVNVIFLNILWLIFSIPVITIGAATTAMYSVMMKMARDREGYIFKSFWKAFKENFRQSTAIWLIVIAVSTIVCADIYFFFTVEWGSIGKCLGAVFIGIAIIVAFGIMYVFPLQAQFENKIKQTVINALLVASKHFAWTMLLFLIHIITAFAVYLFWYAAGWCIIGIGAYLCALIYNRIFRKYIPEELRDEY